VRGQKARGNSDDGEKDGGEGDGFGVGGFQAEEERASEGTVVGGDGGATKCGCPALCYPADGMARDSGTGRHLLAAVAAVAAVIAGGGDSAAAPGCAGARASAAVKLAVAEPEDRKPAPPFSLPNASGHEVSLDAHRGEVVVLNFWATWCHGCKQELPWFVRFEKEYGSRGMTVIGASTDADGWKSVTPYLKKKPLNYPVVIADEALTSAYGLGAMPMTVLIDRQGRIAATYTGVVDRAACDSAIQSLLRETAAGP